MKRTTGILVPLLLFVGTLKYLPIFFFPDLVNDIYYDYSIEITIAVSILMLILIAIHPSKRNLLTGICYVSIILFSVQVREIDNRLIIAVNRNREIKDFYSPVPGYKIERYFTLHRPSVAFKYNHIPGGYTALIYEKDHRNTPDSFDGDACFEKIYDNNWWLYNEID